jgi:hypothetical protein
MVTGAVTQVQLVSNQDAWLTLNPESTFFQQEYSRHTPFALMELDVNVAGARFNSTLLFEVPRAADLAGAQFLNITRKGLRLDFTGLLAAPDNKVLFVPESGYAMVDFFQLIIGSNTVDTLSGEFSEILEQHATAIGNDQGEMIGSFDTTSDLRDWTFNDQEMFIAIRWFFFDHPEMYLPIIALSAHGVKVKIVLRSLNLLVNAFTATGVAFDPFTSAVAGEVVDATFNGSLVDAKLTCRYVFVDQFERNLISAEVHEIVNLEHQEEVNTVVAALATSSTTSISFNNAILSIFARFRLDSKTESTNLDTKDFFDYTVARPGIALVGGVGPYDQQPPWVVGASALAYTPIKTWQIKFNGSDRVQTRAVEYFTHCMPFLHAVRKSRHFATLSYYFHLSPLTDYHTPAGHAMFSRLHEVKSIFTFDKAGTASGGGSVVTASGTIAHFSQSSNVVRISHGQLVRKFA